MSFVHTFYTLMQGYHPSKKPYNGKVTLSTLQKSARNKTIEIGEIYNIHITGNYASNGNYIYL